MTREACHAIHDQIVFLRAATANALMTVLAGFAFTTVSLPNIILLVAFVAGFLLVLILARPGMVNTPAFFTSAAPTSAKLPKSLVTTLLFNSALVASASARAPLVMLVAPAFFMPPFAMMIRRVDASVSNTSKQLDPKLE